MSGDVDAAGTAVGIEEVEPALRGDRIEENARLALDVVIDQEGDHVLVKPICFRRRATRAAFSGGGGSRRIRSVRSRLRSSQ